MTRTPRPTTSAGTARFRRPGWREPRVLIGTGLVLASVAGTTAAVTLGDQTETYAVAAQDLGVGASVGQEQVRAAQVRLDTAAGAYVRSPADLPQDAVLLERIPAGQLIPRSAVGSAEQLRLRPMSIPLSAAPPARLGAGDMADVWASERERTGRGWTRAEQILAGAELSGVQEASGLGAQQPSVELLVPQEDVPAVVDALSGESRLTLVPHAGPAA